MNRFKYFFILIIVLVSFTLGYQISKLNFSELSNIKNLLVNSTGTNIFNPYGSCFIDVDSETEMNKFRILDYKKMNLVYDALVEKFFDKKKFLDAHSGSNMTDEALRGIVEGLGDPYTVYLKPTKSVELKDSINGILDGGIGAQLTQRGKDIIVVSPIKKTPAEKAGIKARDIILKVDDVSMDGKSVNDAVKMIRGPKGTQVKLTIGREGEGIKEFIIVRDEIRIPSLTSKIQSGILIIELIQFDIDTNDEIKELIAENDLSDIKGIVLDLRNNPGGFMDGAVDLASYWTEKGDLIVYRREYTGKRYDMYSKGYMNFAKKPTIVIVNGASASSSEIAAGALSYYKKAYIIGERTFGKGSVQEIVDFEDSSALKVTTAKWYMPDGKNIDHAGVEPDYYVSNNIDNLKNGIDDQLNTALDILISGKFPPKTNTGSTTHNILMENWDPYNMPKEDNKNFNNDFNYDNDSDNYLDENYENNN